MSNNENNTNLDYYTNYEYLDEVLTNLEISPCNQNNILPIGVDGKVRLAEL